MSFSGTTFGNIKPSDKINEVVESIAYNKKQSDSFYTSKISKITNYLYSQSIDTLDYVFANNYFNEHSNKLEAVAGSVVRNGDLYGRNYDWKYDKSATIVIETPKTTEHFASISVSRTPTGVTTEDLDNKSIDADLLKIIPFLALDGINENGVICSVTAIHGDEASSGRWNGTKICGLAAIRYVLDNAKTAEEGANLLKDNVWMPESDKLDGYTLHYMVADKDNTFIVEDGVYKSSPTSSPATIMTDFRLVRNNSLIAHNDVNLANVAEYDPYGNGIERFTEAKGMIESSSSMYSIMSELRFTKAYSLENEAYRPSEFAGVKVNGVSLRCDQRESINDWYQKNYIGTNFNNRERNGKYWQSVHTSLYNIVNKTLNLYVQEDYNNVFTFPSTISIEKIENVSVEDVKEAKKITFKKITLGTENVIVPAVSSPIDDEDVNNGNAADEGWVEHALNEKVDVLPTSYVTTNGKNGFRVEAYKDKNGEWRCDTFNLPEGFKGPIYNPQDRQDISIAFEVNDYHYGLYFYGEESSENPLTWRTDAAGNEYFDGDFPSTVIIHNNGFIDNLIDHSSKSALFSDDSFKTAVNKQVEEIISYDIFGDDNYIKLKTPIVLEYEHDITVFIQLKTIDHSKLITDVETDDNKVVFALTTNGTDHNTKSTVKYIRQDDENQFGFYTDDGVASWVNNNDSGVPCMTFSFSSAVHSDYSNYAIAENNNGVVNTYAYYTNHKVMNYPTFTHLYLRKGLVAHISIEDKLYGWQGDTYKNTVTELSNEYYDKWYVLPCKLSEQAPNEKVDIINTRGMVNAYDEYVINKLDWYDETENKKHGYTAIAIRGSISDLVKQGNIIGVSTKIGTGPKGDRTPPSPIRVKLMGYKSDGVEFYLGTSKITNIPSEGGEVMFEFESPIEVNTANYAQIGIEFIGAISTSTIALFVCGKQGDKVDDYGHKKQYVGWESDSCFIATKGSILHEAQMYPKPHTHTKSEITDLEIVAPSSDTALRGKVADAYETGNALVRKLDQYDVVMPNTDLSILGRAADAYYTGAELANKYEKPDGGIPLSDINATEFPPSSHNHESTEIKVKYGESEFPLVAAPSVDAKTGQAADAKKTGEGLASKRDTADLTYTKREVVKLDTFDFTPVKDALYSRYGEREYASEISHRGHVYVIMVCLDSANGYPIGYSELAYPDLPLAEAATQIKIVSAPDHPEVEGIVLKKEKVITEEDSIALKSDIPTVVAPSANTSLSGKAADAYETGNALPLFFKSDPAKSVFRSGSNGEPILEQIHYNLRYHFPSSIEGDVTLAIADQLSGITSQDIDDFRKYRDDLLKGSSFRSGVAINEGDIVDCRAYNGDLVRAIKSFISRGDSGDYIELGASDAVYTPTDSFQKLLDIYDKIKSHIPEVVEPSLFWSASGKAADAMATATVLERKYEKPDGGIPLSDINATEFPPSSHNHESTEIKVKYGESEFPLVAAPSALNPVTGQAADAYETRKGLGRKVDKDNLDISYYSNGRSRLIRIISGKYSNVFESSDYKIEFVSNPMTSKIIVTDKSNNVSDDNATENSDRSIVAVLNGSQYVFEYISDRVLSLKDLTDKLTDSDLDALCTACGISLAKTDGTKKTRAEKLIDMFGQSNSQLAATIRAKVLADGEGEIKAALFADTAFSKACAYKLHSLTNSDKNSSGAFVCHNRAINSITVGTDAVTIEFPTKAVGETYGRDFIIRITGGTGGITINLPTETSKHYGDAFPTVESNKNYLIAITETSEDEWFVKSIELMELQQ